MNYLSTIDVNHVEIFSSDFIWYFTGKLMEEKGDEKSFPDEESFKFIWPD